MALARSFGRLSLFFLVGGVAATLAMKSVWPLLVVGLALGGLLRFANALGRRRG